MGSLIRSLLEWALFFGVTGGLVDVTLAMRNQAAQAHQMGLTSLSELNRHLVGRDHRGKNKSNNPISHSKK